MPRTRSILGRTALVAAIALCFPLSPGAARAFDEPEIKGLLAQAERHELKFEWESACDIYETILRAERNLPEVRGRYIHTLRRCWQMRRNKDASYRKDVLGLDYGQAVRLYTSVLDNLLDNSLDAKNVAPGILLQKGIDELSLALADPNFRQLHLPADSTAEAREFREWLAQLGSTVSSATRSQVRKQVREIALSAMSKLKMSSTVAVMELASGSCYAFDDYTVYLTPAQLQELCESLKGQYVSVGISPVLVDGKMMIVGVAPLSPAAETMPPLSKDEQIVSIGKKAVANLTPDAVLELLEGPAGSSVEVELSSPAGTRTVNLRRRALFIPSVKASMCSDLVGYMTISCFQETTLQEVDEALVNLKKNNMKALVLDLRGNSGGLFEVAVEVARRFIDQGVIVSTQSASTSTIYHARNSAALGVPLVVLVDGETASSAEVLAIALKDNKRGRLVGQTTFGKGCTQSIFKLPSGPGNVPTGGLRITVARFFSPEGISYSGRGVLPHMFVGRVMMPMSNMPPMDHQLEEAILEAQRLMLGS